MRPSSYTAMRAAYGSDARAIFTSRADGGEAEQQAGVALKAERNKLRAWLCKTNC